MISIQYFGLRKDLLLLGKFSDDFFRHFFDELFLNKGGREFTNSMGKYFTLMDRRATALN